jgi:hypothetical protein
VARSPNETEDQLKDAFQRGYAIALAQEQNQRAAERKARQARTAARRQARASQNPSAAAPPPGDSPESSDKA